MDKALKPISPNFFYYGLYLLVLITPFVIQSFEASMAVASLVLFLCLFQARFKVPISLLNALTLLLIICLLAFVVHFFYDNKFYDVIKDAVYLIKPLVYLFLGYFLAHRLKNKEDIFRGIIYLAIALAILHMIKVVGHLFEVQEFQVNNIRNKNGKDNFLELLACSLLVLNKNNKYFKIEFRYKKLVLFILAISFIFYFSRTMFVAFIIIWLAVNGYTKLTKKSLTVITLLLVGVFIFYRILFSMDIERGAEGFEGFLYKLKIAPSEIFSAEINLKDPSERWDHWRAYEAKKAIEQVNDTQGRLGLIFGKGMGSLVDLGFEADLGAERLQFIPKIHNGYIYVLFKTGLLGLLLYLLLLIYLYLQAYNHSNHHYIQFINNLTSGIALFYLFTSFIISGIYNPKDVYSIFLGALLFLQIHYRKVS